MKQQELSIYSPEGAIIARLWFNGARIECSSDTSNLFREAVEYLLDNKPFVLYSQEGEPIAEQLFGHSERSLGVLSRYYKYSMGFTTVMAPRLDIDMVFRLSLSKTRHAIDSNPAFVAPNTSILPDAQWEKINQRAAARSVVGKYSEAA